MGAVKIDILKRDNSLMQKYPIASLQGVVSFLDNIHHLRIARFKGDIDSSTMLLDFMDAYKSAGLSKRENEVLYYRYEKELTLKETAKELGISIESVSQYGRQGCEKIARKMGENGGYDLEV